MSKILAFLFLFPDGKNGVLYLQPYSLPIYSICSRVFWQLISLRPIIYLFGFGLLIWQHLFCTRVFPLLEEQLPNKHNSVRHLKFSASNTYWPDLMEVHFKGKETWRFNGEKLEQSGESNDHDWKSSINCTTFLAEGSSLFSKGATLKEWTTW